MAENTTIEWCDHTFNPWIGCTKVSPGCANCYAEAMMDKRLGKVRWGKGQPRERTSPANWKQVERWNRESGSVRDNGMYYRSRIFVASLADWLDPEVPIEWLADLLNLIRRCPHLDFLLLTKRPELWSERIFSSVYTHLESVFAENSIPSLRNWPLFNWVAAWVDGNPPPNVWLGTSVEDQQRADERIPALLKIPAKVRFLSCEPLLESVSIEPWLSWPDGVTGDVIDWVICGGESGPNARPMHPDWARELRDQCQSAGVPFLFKQWGEWVQGDFDFIRDRTIYCPFNGSVGVSRVGKKAAGRLLDGREWNEFPNPDKE